MSHSPPRRELPAGVGAGVAIILVGILAYAFITANILLGVFVAVGIGSAVYLLHLFHRLVVAVEEIAFKL
ncbi:hypothetical protein ATJ93_0911 [Halopiger aswanensis]|uniref:Uncharacterized protein n=1 Tax=Halopiger aswanensis TaxID=148449 RepID=A0A419WQX8_9EURY|nr:hypothetical protein ATJ93_0911 [Halopiger aswanensis]